jgi:hypothetical protein
MKSRKVTRQSIACAVRHLEYAFWRYSHEAIADALRKSGIDGGTAAFVGQFLCDLWESKILEEHPAPRCAECGGITARGPLDTSRPRSNARYCSNKCRQKAYRKRYGKKALCKPSTVTQGETVTVLHPQKVA